jgi:hypothetical protein
MYLMKRTDTLQVVGGQLWMSDEASPVSNQSSPCGFSELAGRVGESTVLVPDNFL